MRDGLQRIRMKCNLAILSSHYFEDSAIIGIFHHENMKSPANKTHFFKIINYKENIHQLLTNTTSIFMLQLNLIDHFEQSFQKEEINNLQQYL